MGFMFASAADALGGLTANGSTTIARNWTVLGYATLTGSVSGMPVGSATQPAADLTANAADVYTKHDMDMYLFFEASALGPSSTWSTTALSLTVTSGATVDGNLSVTGAGKSVTAFKNPSSTI